MATITKLKDNRFEGNHPNYINEGYTKSINFKPSKPYVGQCYYFGSLRTSMVTKINKETESEIEFETLNSTYLITK